MDYSNFDNLILINNHEYIYRVFNLNFRDRCRTNNCCLFKKLEYFEIKYNEYLNNILNKGKKNLFVVNFYSLDYTTCNRLIFKIKNDKFKIFYDNYDDNFSINLKFNLISLI